MYLDVGAHPKRIVERAKFVLDLRWINRGRREIARRCTGELF